MIVTNLLLTLGVLCDILIIWVLRKMLVSKGPNKNNDFMKEEKNYNPGNLFDPYGNLDPVMPSFKDEDSHTRKYDGEYQE